MKVLSLLQPWASLVVLGHKKIETRSFQRSHRGPLLIHSSKNNDRSLGIIHAHFCERYLPTEQMAIFQDLPFGAIIGMVNLMNCVPSWMCQKDVSLTFAPHLQIDNSWDITDKELAFGDYSPKRFGWLLADPVVFEQPIPAKGNLGLWTPDEETMAKVNEQILLSSSNKL